MKTNYNATGSSRINIEFEHEISKIASLDNSIEPEVLIVLCNTEIMQIKENLKSTIKKCSSKPKSLTTTMWEIHKTKEEARDRRLKEKFDFFKGLFDEKK